ncbi:MAG: hypothetical protein A4E65_00093 [Syntrophorhabdus sp. PtaU1.Bin153]|nr:MAG: hypothetical protein A4E65_00093 [Syntrophorhabdus sp. PtaU1.Bin153]
MLFRKELFRMGLLRKYLLRMDVYGRMESFIKIKSRTGQVFKNLKPYW